jgi:hypothetical protein
MKKGENKYEKGQKNKKKTRCKHRSETEVITRRRALRSARLKKFECIKFQHFWLFYAFLVRMPACTIHIK